MKVVAALIASIVGVGIVGTGALAQAQSSDAVALTEPQPIPEDFNEVSVDSRDLETESVGISSPEVIDVRTVDLISEISLIQVERRDFPGLDEIYRDPGPARANWFRILLQDRESSRTESDADTSNVNSVDASDTE
jgi:hypothetical protein